MESSFSTSPSWALSIFLAYPPKDKIKLGLDLKGGIHLVLQVLTEDAINVETDQEIIRFQELFKKNNITFQTATKERPGRFVFTGTSADQEGKTRDLIDQYTRDWDYSFTGRQADLHPEGRWSPSSSRTRPSTRPSRPSATGSTSSASPSR